LYVPDFRLDLEAAGMATAYEGEPFEFRSTRRSFTTWLDVHGVPGEVADRLIRHKDDSVRGKHYKGETPESVARLASAIGAIRLDLSLPETFGGPGDGGGGNGVSVEEEKGFEPLVP